jgi:hypothetical protein
MTAGTTQIRLRLMLRYAPDSGEKPNIVGLARWAKSGLMRRSKRQQGLSHGQFRVLLCRVPF